MKSPPPRAVSASGSRPCNADLPEFVRRFLGGEHEAFDRIVECLSPRLYSIALRSLGNAEAAEEVLQESWVRIYRRLGGLKDPQAFEGWAIRVTLSRINDEFRARARERTARESLTELRQALGPGPEKLSPAEREDLARVLRESLESLDETHREVFILREVEGLPHIEIARLLGIPEGTVWSRLSYARKALRDHLTRRKEGLS